MFGHVFVQIQRLGIGFSTVRANVDLKWFICPPKMQLNAVRQNFNLKMFGLFVLWDMLKQSRFVNETFVATEIPETAFVIKRVMKKPIAFVGPISLMASGVRL